MLSMFFAGALLANRLTRRKPAFFALFIPSRLLYLPVAFIPLIFPDAPTDWVMGAIIVMIAVGVDYSIFLAARLAQEARHRSKRQAAWHAIVKTGPVISSCGVIMAATLGSLAAGDLQLLRQLGFALALGMLLDTFIVRPLLLPAFAVLTGRTGRATALDH